jgi:hypothetical protein
MGMVMAETKTGCGEMVLTRKYAGNPHDTSETRVSICLIAEV